VLSGTLSFVLARTMAGTRLSEAVEEAFRRGLTEPRPAEDLVGLDVARKALILARAAGFELEPEAVEVGAVLPAEGWLELGLEEFWARLPELDEPFAARAAEARAVGRSLVSIATVTPAGARVSLEVVPTDHPCAGVAVSDNLVAFTTDRYRSSPLTIRGPGAGPRVTAAGLLADVIRAAAAAGPG
jgi:homoserine dehydrogenase